MEVQGEVCHFKKEQLSVTNIKESQTLLMLFPLSFQLEGETGPSPQLKTKSETNKQQSKWNTKISHYLFCFLSLPCKILIFFWLLGHLPKKRNALEGRQVPPANWDWKSQSFFLLSDALQKQKYSSSTKSDRLTENIRTIYLVMKFLIDSCQPFWGDKVCIYVSSRWLLLGLLCVSKVCSLRCAESVASKDLPESSETCYAALIDSKILKDEGFGVLEPRIHHLSSSSPKIGLSDPENATFQREHGQFYRGMHYQQPLPRNNLRVTDLTD